LSKKKERCRSVRGSEKKEGGEFQKEQAILFQSEKLGSKSP